jgi:exopolyphosphatase/guanosine-5'-triphosphate,3'-diphosphate pyrophosphatase
LTNSDCRCDGKGATDSPIDNPKSTIVNPPIRVAVIDVGTNTVRLLVAETGGRSTYRTVLTAQETTRLGQGLFPAQVLQPEPIQRTVRVLRRFRELAESQGASTIFAVGTSALRVAANRAAFLALARNEAGLEIAVISGAEEGRLALLGVRTGLPRPPDRLVMLDIGGGSTELLLAEGPRILASASTGLGAVTLTERFLKTDPPAPAELDAVRRAAASRFGRLLREEFHGLASDAGLAGTAGTVTSLAAIDLGLDPYDPGRVNGHRLTRERVAELLRRLASLPLAHRRGIRGLEAARADVIVAGTAVCLAAMDALGADSLTVSDGGLREGILLDLLRRNAPVDRPADA